MTEQGSFIQQMVCYRDSKQQKKLAQLRQNVEKYEKQFQENSSCRNLRYYNQALAALKQYEKRLHISE